MSENESGRYDFTVATAEESDIDLGYIQVCNADNTMGCWFPIGDIESVLDAETRLIGKHVHVRIDLVE